MTAGTAPSTVRAVWWVITRSIATRVRVAGLGLLGAAAVALGVAVRLAQPANRPNAAWTLVDSYGLSLLIPVVALVFASASLGDLAEDGTLVYLWLRPLPRWQLAGAAFAATVTVVVPLAVLPLVIGAAISGQGARLVGAAAAGGLLATVAYSAVFCACDGRWPGAWPFCSSGSKPWPGSHTGRPGPRSSSVPARSQPTSPVIRPLAMPSPGPRA
jgi:hypothetical protein